MSLRLSPSDLPRLEHIGSTPTTIHKTLYIRVVFHAYLVYLFTHIWSTFTGFPRIFGLHLRINGLHATRILLILIRMLFPPIYLYENPIWIVCSSSAHCGKMDWPKTGKNLRPLTGKGAYGA